MLLDKNEALVCFKIPADLIGPWIAYCRRWGYTQSRMIRAAIAEYINMDNTATDKELAMAARICEYGYGYDPRGPAEQPNDQPPSAQGELAESPTP